MKDDLQASNELVAEVNEKLTTAVQDNTESVKELNKVADLQLVEINQLAKSVADFSVKRREELRQKIEKNGPIVRYSDQVEDKPEVKETVQQMNNVVRDGSGKKAQSQSQVKADDNDSGKIKRVRSEGSSIVSAIGKMGMDVAGSITAAAKDFAGNLVDTIGSEILPLYPQLKQAVTTVGEGVSKAAKTGYSAFQRVRDPEAKAKALTLEKTETKSMFERITNNGVQREKTTKVVAMQQAHRDRKLLKKVDDIYDFMKLRALFDVLKFAGLMTSLGGVGSAIVGMAATIGTMLVFFKDKIFATLKTMSTKLSDLIGALRDFGKGLVDDAKSMVDKVKKKLGFESDADKDKSKKPDVKSGDGEKGKTANQSETEKPKSKVERVSSAQAQAEAGKTAQAVETAGDAVKPNKAAGLAGEAVETAVEKKGKSAVAGEIMTVIGSMTSGLSKLAGLLMRGLGVAGWAYTGYEVGEAVADVDSHPESVKRVNRFLADSGSMNDPMMMQAGIEPESVAVETAGERLRQAEAEREIRKEQRGTMQQVTNSPMMNIQNNTTIATEPFRFTQDQFSQSLPHGMQSRF